jgi:hypothetical protein
MRAAGDGRGVESGQSAKETKPQVVVLLKLTLASDNGSELLQGPIAREYGSQ